MKAMYYVYTVYLLMAIFSELWTTFTSWLGSINCTLNQTTGGTPGCQQTRGRRQQRVFLKKGAPVWYSASTNTMRTIQYRMFRNKSVYMYIVIWKMRFTKQLFLTLLLGVYVEKNQQKPSSRFSVLEIPKKGFYQLSALF